MVTYIQVQYGKPAQENSVSTLENMDAIAGGSRKKTKRLFREKLLLTLNESESLRLLD